jgi:POT family proton-dependent oligopeptide transporter
MFKNHPAGNGLATLFFTEMWERFGFYTMMAILTLYMDVDFGWNDVHKADLYGIFLGAVYFFPIVGGFIADKLLGYRNTIRIGAVILSIGYATLAFSSINRISFFYSGLALITIGNGLFKANISVLVGNLYPQGSKLKDAGYNIFYMGINIGAFLAPLAATALYDLFQNYNVSFGAASLGMLISMTIFQLGRRTYDQTGNIASATPQDSTTTYTEEMDRKEQMQRMISLGILFLIAIFFWMAFYQNGFALTLFAQRSTIRSELLRPETYQFFGPFFIVILTPFVVSIFNLMRKSAKEPSSSMKIFFGMFIAGLSLVVMVIASLMGGNRDANLMSPAWLISTYFVITIAEILVSPMGLSFVSKVAPPRISGLMMGCWFGATAIGAYSSGLLGRFYSALPHHQYFMVLAGLLFGASGLVFAFIRKLNRFGA